MVTQATTKDEMPRLTRGDMDEKLDRYVELVPEHCRDGLLNYLRYGVPPGHFLQAVLSNDLREACARADDVNIAAIYNYVLVLNNYAPSAAWGSPEKVREWIERGMHLRREHMAEGH
jgi:hypothetical protein